MVKVRLVIWLVCFACSAAMAQGTGVNRYVVYFSDKANSPFSINSPQQFLTPRAIERRAKQNIPIAIQDLPVNPSYLDSLRGLGFTVFHPSRWLNAAIVQDTPDKVQLLAQKPYIDTVILVARNTKLTSQLSSYTPPLQYTVPSTTSLSSASQNAIIGVDKMHELGYRGEGMLIAVLDGGFSGTDKSNVFMHLFENGQLADHFDFVTHGRDVFRYDDHGTCVLSTLAAVSPNNYTGTAPKAHFALYVTEESGSEFVIEEYNLLMATERADSIGADILNASVGYNDFDDSSMDYTYSDLNGTTAIGTFAANTATLKGMVFVSSAGNEGNKAWKYVTVPADGENVLAIGAISANRSLANFSSVGPTSDGRIKPDLIALGSPSVVLGAAGNFFNGFGTSYSAPQIAGLAAGVWQARPDWTALQVINALRMSGDISRNPNNTRGYGVPNFQRAISGTVLSVRDIIEEKITVYPNPFDGDLLNIMIDKSIKEPTFKLTLFDYSGREIKQWRVSSTYDELIQIETGPLSDGHYILYFEFKKSTKSVKLIKF